MRDRPVISPLFSLIPLHPSTAAGHVRECLASGNSNLHPRWWLGLNEGVVSAVVSGDMAEDGSALVVGW